MHSDRLPSINRDGKYSMGDIFLKGIPVFDDQSRAAQFGEVKGYAND
jgi:hypothetical protein